MRIIELATEEVEVMALKNQLAAVKKEADKVAGLPLDMKRAKEEMDKLNKELESLRRKRDMLWEEITR
jgi:uncharacterized coiled-coil DUF342 family protein